MTESGLWGEYSVGMVKEWPVSFSSQNIKQFAELSGDYNPLHTDSAFAKSKGFDAPLIYGLLLASQMSRLIGQQLPDKHAILTGIQMDFLRPSFPDDQLSFKAILISKSDAVLALEFDCQILKEDILLCRGKVNAIWRP